MLDILPALDLKLDATNNLAWTAVLILLYIFWPSRRNKKVTLASTIYASSPGCWRAYYYCDDKGCIIQLVYRLDNTNWTNIDITSKINAPKATSSTLILISPDNSRQHILFRSGDSLYQLSQEEFGGSIWSCTNVTDKLKGSSLL
jgi:hypothetical protein